MLNTTKYTSVIIFGKEISDSVASALLFQELVRLISSFLMQHDIKLKCRGIIEGQNGKHIGPRASAFNSKSAENWATYLASGTFMNFQIYDAGWSAPATPRVYASINKLWGYSNSAYTERTTVGAENCIILALANDYGENMEDVLSLAVGIAKMTSGFYGFAEEDASWSQRYGTTSFSTRAIDLSWYDVPEVDYRRGKYDMNHEIPRLHKFNFLTSQHIKGGDLTELSQTNVCDIQLVTDKLFLLTLVNMNQSGPTLHGQLAEYFNLIPTS